MKKIKTPAIYCFIVAISILLLNGQGQARGQRWSVSIHPQINPGERVVGYEATFVNADVVSIPKLPVCWSVSKVNDPQWKTKIGTQICVGSAALLDSEMDYFSDFLVIEKDHFNSDIKMEIEVWVTKDIETQRSVKFEKNDIVLTPLPEGPKW
jgi:hypothetical protein